MSWSLASLIATPYLLAQGGGFDLLKALVPVAVIIILVLSQILGGNKEKAQARRRQMQQQRRPPSGQPKAEGQEKIDQEVNEFLRRSGEQDRASDPFQDPQPERQPRQHPRHQPRRPQQKQPTTPDLAEAEIVEAVVVTDKLIHAEEAREHRERRQATHKHSLRTRHEEATPAQPLQESDRVVEHSYDAARDSATTALNRSAFAAAIAGIFRDPEQARKAIIAREVLDRPDFDRW